MHTVFSLGQVVKPRDASDQLQNCFRRLALKISKGWGRWKLVPLYTSHGELYRGSWRVVNRTDYSCRVEQRWHQSSRMPCTDYRVEQSQGLKVLRRQITRIGVLAVRSASQRYTLTQIANSFLCKRRPGILLILSCSRYAWFWERNSTASAFVIDLMLFLWGFALSRDTCSTWGP